MVVLLTNNGEPWHHVAVVDSLWDLSPCFLSTSTLDWGVGVQKIK